MRNQHVARLVGLAIVAAGAVSCASEASTEETESSFEALSCNDEQLAICKKYGGGAACTSKWCSSSGSAAPASGSSISAVGQKQMRDVIDYALTHNSGASRGRCFEYVWRYLTASRYGALDDYNDAADMPSAYARNFAEYMNANGNAARWGLQRLALSNPYDAPPGAVVVVAAGSPGTSHPTAGDISIAAGGGRFVNDGPYMSYGGSRAAFTSRGGRVLGIYAPR